mgnify:FL=1
MKNIINKIKKFYNKYKNYIIIGFILFIGFTFFFNGCDKDIKQIIMKPAYEKIDSLNVELEKSKETEELLKQQILERKSNVKDLYKRIYKVDRNKLKKDDEILIKKLSNDSLTTTQRIEYWTREFNY